MSALKKHFHTTLDIENGRVEMAHGGGGRAMAQLIDRLFLSAFDNDMLNAGNDMAVFNVPASKMAMSTDAYVISPLFFPGGDIGSMAVHGTVNDVSMSGAKPLYLSASYILEEGFPLKDLKKIVDSMANAAKKAGVYIVTGDTKVVEKGSADGVFITTAGVGVIPDDVDVSGNGAKIGDKIILSGTLGDHGIAVMSKREGLSFEVPVLSDSAALNHIVEALVNKAPKALHCMRDATRGGLAATLNEIAVQSGVGMMLDEEKIPVKAEVMGACELLGLDPLNIANEGKMICVCDKDHALDLLAAMKSAPYGQNAAIIGEVIEDENSFVQMKTAFGTTRIVDWLAGEQLPRIC